MSRVDPTEWANKRKVAIENAKKIREDKKNGIGNGDGEIPTFTPQVNKRPQYLNQQKDSLDNEVRIQTNDIFEQPLPGAKAKQVDIYNGGLPSPGSDALGKEMKNYSSSNKDSYSYPQKETDAQYKSRFLQQYETEKQLKNSKMKENTHEHIFQQQQQQQQDDEFARMLRPEPSRSSGPGWNDDTSSSGFETKGPANRHVIKKQPPPQAPIPRQNQHQSQQQMGGDANGRYDNGPRAQQQPVRSRPQAQQEWNHDTESASSALYSNPPPPRVSPRPLGNSQISPRGNQQQQSAAAGVQHSKLSLLKSKIRNSESSGGARVVQQAPSMSNFSNSNSERKLPSDNSEYAIGGGRNTAPNSFSGGNGYNVNGNGQHDNNSRNPSREYYEAEVVAAPPRAGRRGPPPQQAPPARQQVQQYAEDEYDNGYQPTVRNGRNNPPVKQQQPPQQPQRNNDRWLEEETPSDRYNPPARPQPQRSQPPVQQQPQQQQYRQPPPAPVAQAPSSYNNTMSEYPPADDEEAAGEQPQHECPDCGRKFNLIPYQKHVKICAKVFLQKRKAFDSTKMRINDNPELVQIINKVKKEEKKKAVQEKKNPPRAADNQPVAAEGGGGAAKWKQESNAFREAMKAARNYSKAVAKGENPPPVIASAPDPSLKPCPHCNRRFNEKAAERHIPLCNNIRAKPTQLKRGVGGGGGVNGAPSTSNKGKGRF